MNKIINNIENQITETNNTIKNLKESIKSAKNKDEIEYINKSLDCYMIILFNLKGARTCTKASKHYHDL